MDISFAFPAAVSLAGAALYLIASAPKVVEIGRLLFFAGLLVFLLHFAGRAALHIG